MWTRKEAGFSQNPPLEEVPLQGRMDRHVEEEPHLSQAPVLPLSKCEETRDPLL